MNEVGAFARRKCPCCNNPWSAASEETKEGGSTPMASLPSLPCDPCLADNKGFSGLDPSNIDPSVSLKENFYLWSNGNWMKNNQIPAEYSSWNTFISLRDTNLSRIQVILQDLSANGDISTKEISSNEQKLSDFYTTALDESLIESQGLAVLQPLLDICHQASKNPTLAIAELHAKFGVNVLFHLYADADSKDSSHTIGNISQSGLGLPDRDYYFDEDKAEKRAKYLAYISSLFTCLHKEMPNLVDLNTPRKCELAAKEVMLIETGLAKAFMTRTERRDPEKTYNLMSQAELSALTREAPTHGSYLARGPNQKSFEWGLYFDAIGKSGADMGSVNVRTVEALKKVECVINHPSFTHYLLFHSLNAYAPHLTHAMTEAHFAFHETELKGTKEQKPRWKRSLEALEEALGDALGVCYVERYFAGDAKTRALRIVERVKDALRARLNEVRN